MPAALAGSAPDRRPAQRSDLRRCRIVSKAGAHAAADGAVVVGPARGGLAAGGNDGESLWRPEGLVPFGAAKTALDVVLVAGGLAAATVADGVSKRHRREKRIGRLPPPVEG